jgi:hypothetical protein
MILITAFDQSAPSHGERISSSELKIKILSNTLDTQRRFFLKKLEGQNEYNFSVRCIYLYALVLSLTMERFPPPIV